MKNYAKEYKGLKVPEGATHYNEANMLWPECFIDAKYGRVYEIDGNGWKLSTKTMPITAVELPQVEQEWNGEGLPPVGCECVMSYDGHNWSRCVINYSSAYTIVCTNESGIELNYSIKDTVVFRPLKTRKEKDREAFIVKCHSVTNELGTNLCAAFGDLFDANFKAPGNDNE